MNNNHTYRFTTYKIHQIFAVASCKTRSRVGTRKVRKVERLVFFFSLSHVFCSQSPGRFVSKGFKVNSDIQH